MAPPVRWTIETIAEGFKKYIDEFGRYPTANEVDVYPYLPSAKQIQRSFGGLVAIRERLKLDGPTDFTKGTYSSERSKEIGQRAHRIEKEVYGMLTKQFGLPFVHREYFFTDDRRTRTDFFVHSKSGNFCVDVFFPKDRKNLINCLNSKMRTYGQSELLDYPVIFLMMNDRITQEEIKHVVDRKTNKLASNQRVMTYDELKVFCRKRLPFTVN